MRRARSVRHAAACALAVVLALVCSAPSWASPSPPSARRAQIVGGSAALITDHPHQVWVTRQSEDLICGGSILDPTHVVTAAHCVISDDAAYPLIASPIDYKVGYGGASRSAGMTFAGVSRIVVDRRYQRLLKSDAYDMAILQLSAPITFSPSAAPIAPATAAELASAFGSGAPGSATGWGLTSPSDGGSLSDELQGVSLPLVTDSVCGQIYRSYLVGGYAPSTMLCAGAVGVSACLGDSGGPLTIGGTGVNRRLAGIASLVLGDNGGNLCNAGGSPAVFTEVSEPATRSLLVAPPALDPPVTPSADAAIAGIPRVGQRVTCQPPPSAGGQPVRYLFYVTSGTDLSLFAQQAASTITLPAATQGQRVLCDARYENAAGFAYSDTSPAGLAGPIGPPLPPPPDTTAPVASRFSMSHRRFRVGSRKTPLSAGRRAAPRGTTFRFRLSEAATAQITIQRRLSGRRKGPRCLPPSRKLRDNRRCTRYVHKAKLTRSDLKAGAVTVAFSGRLKSGALRPGAYRATVSAVDGAGNRSRRRSVSFTVVRR